MVATWRLAWTNETFEAFGTMSRRFPSYHTRIGSVRHTLPQALLTKPLRKRHRTKHGVA